MLELQTFCRQEEIPVRIQTLGMESLVTRARNTLVANFLDDEDVLQDLIGYLILLKVWKELNEK